MTPNPPGDRATPPPERPLSGGAASGLSLFRPVTSPSADGEGYVLMAPYYAPILPGFDLLIATGFFFDGCSIPRLGWTLLGLHPMHPRVQASALIHDALYASEMLARREADDVFLWCLRQDGLDTLRARLMWRGVRLGGGAVWRRHTPDSITTARLYVSLHPHIA